jgi:hypothetical protein
MITSRFEYRSRHPHSPGHNRRWFFSDELNTVSLLIKSGHWSKRGKYLLGLDAIMRISGASLGL